MDSFLYQIDLAEVARLRDADLSGIVSDAEYLTLRWPGYDYEIEWSRIKTQIDLVSWLHHLCTKFWFTSSRQKVFIEHVCAHRGWRLYR